MCSLSRKLGNFGPVEAVFSLLLDARHSVHLNSWNEEFDRESALRVEITKCLGAAVQEWIVKQRFLWVLLSAALILAEANRFGWLKNPACVCFLPKFGNLRKTRAKRQNATRQG